MDLTNRMRTKITKMDKSIYSLENLKSRIDNVGKEYVGKMFLCFDTNEKYMSEISEIISKTISYHISQGDISPRFEREFRQFLASVITLNIQ